MKLSSYYIINRSVINIGIGLFCLDFAFEFSADVFQNFLYLFFL